VWFIGSGEFVLLIVVGGRDKAPGVASGVRAFQAGGVLSFRVVWAPGFR
jgi:hypothetical protein